MSALDGLKKLRQQLTERIERAESADPKLPVRHATRAEIEARRKLLAKIEADIVRLEKM